MWCEAWKRGCVVVIKVTPRASREGVLGAEAEWLRVALTAPPVDGKANEAARKFLAAALGVPRGSVSLIAGQTARLKRFAIEGLSPAEVQAKLLGGVQR